MSITLHQIKVFVKVAEAMSVSKASQQLHMTQPAVSNIIKQLQDKFDCQLTYVVGRKLHLTTFGESLLVACHDILERIEKAHSDINLLKGAVSGTLSVSCVSTAKYFIPSLLGKFKQDYPEISIKLHVTNRQGIISRLQEDLDDFTVMSHPPSTIPVQAKKFFIDQLIVAGSGHYPQKSKSTSLESLHEASWLTREEGSGTRYAAEKIFKKQKFMPNITMEMSDIEAIKQAIMADIGISVISKHSVMLEIKNGLIRELKVDGFPVNHAWYFVYCKGKTLSPLTDTFFKFTKDASLID